MKGRWIAKTGLIGVGGHFRWIGGPDQVRQGETALYVEGEDLESLLDLEEAQGR